MIHSVHSLQSAVHGLTNGLPSAFGVVFSAVDWRPWTADWSLVPFHFWSLVFFSFGCIVGSFLNVCIHRLPSGMSIVTPKSHCPHCKYSIPWHLNIPLVTWLALRGRCKNCDAPISPRYFIVELLTGAAFLGCWLAFGDAGHPLQSMPAALVYAIFLAGLIVATFIDFEHFIIPDEITLGGMAVGFAASFFLPSLQGATTLNVGMWRSFIGAIVGAATIYAILRLGKWLFGRRSPRTDEWASVGLWGCVFGCGLATVDCGLVACAIPFLVAGFFLVFGCIVGSFLKRYRIHRLPLGQECVVSPPSHCPHCKDSIPWYLNIPLVTRLYLKGRCRNCGAPIPSPYFIVELLTGTAIRGLLARVR